MPTMALSIVCKCLTRRVHSQSDVPHGLEIGIGVVVCLNGA